MWGIQKLGGLAAFVQIGLMVVILLADLVLLPAAGLSPVDGQLPEAGTVLAKNNNPTLVVLDLAALVLSQTIILIWAGLRDRLGGNAPNRSRLAMASASIASVLFVAGSVTSLNSRPMLATIQDETVAVTVGLGLRTITGGLFGGGALMVGWAAILSGWAALSKGGLPKLLSWLLLISGVGLMLPLLPSAIPSPEAALLLYVGIAAKATIPIWTIWLGLLLWHG
ncbi:MAG: hypothetical protein HY741_15100 [Chloroflexi bacterium]|nr:hypothetical protein [Chloroflexota bacterium]